MLIEWLWPVLARMTAQGELTYPWAGAHIFDQQVHSSFAKAQLLVAGIDHIAPKEIKRFVRVIIEHQEAHRGFICIYGAEPGFGLEMSLGDGDCIGGYKMLLGFTYF
jgi:hypothetical protein